jgi:hypothetical protein
MLVLPSGATRIGWKAELGVKFNHRREELASYLENPSSFQIEGFSVEARAAVAFDG